MESSLVQEFLNIGLRPTKMPPEGEVSTLYFLCPTLKGEWIREKAKKINSKWDGSWIPLLIYQSGHAVILVPAGEDWQDLADKISTVIHKPVEARGD